MEYKLNDDEVFCFEYGYDAGINDVLHQVNLTNDEQLITKVNAITIKLLKNRENYRIRKGD